MNAHALKDNLPVRVDNLLHAHRHLDSEKDFQCSGLRMTYKDKKRIEVRQWRPPSNEGNYKSPRQLLYIPESGH